MPNAVLLAVVVLCLGVAAPVAAQDDEPKVVFRTPTYELELIEATDAGVTLLWPADFSLETPVLQAEQQLQREFAHLEPPTAWILIRGKSEMEDWCRLTSFDDHPLTIDEHAAHDRESLVESGFAEELVDDSLWMVDGDFARRLTVSERSDTPATMQTYLFDADGVRFDLTCYSFFGENRAWSEMADSVRPLGSPAQVEPDEAAVDVQRPALDARSHRVELPRAGVAITLPRRWQVIPQDERSTVLLPPPYDELGEINVWRTLEASLELRGCRVYAYDEMPMSLDEHAEWLTSQVSLDHRTPGAPEVEQVVSIENVERVALPLGPSVRLIALLQWEGYVEVIYLFDVDGQRRVLACFDSSLPKKAWLATARTLEPLDGTPAGTVDATPPADVPGPVVDATPPPGVPEDAVSWFELTDIKTVLPVTEVAFGPAYMTAECERALWVELADGSFEERLDCRLTDEPVDRSLEQGGLPQERLPIRGGACQWASDFWAANDGSEVWAKRWKVVVHWDGRALARSWYEPEALDCE